MNENKLFFTQNQKLLLSLINSEAGKSLLGIKNNLPIIAFGENYYTQLVDIKEDKIIKNTNFFIDNRVEQKIGTILTKMEIANEYKRIENPYEAFLHYAGFYRKNYPLILLTDFNPTTGEGNVNSGSHTSWANAKADSVGSATANPAVYAARFDASTWFIIRAFAPFDTSAIPDTDVVTAALFRFYRDDSLDSFANADSTSLIIVPSTQASPTALVNDDLDNISFSNKGSLAFASTSNGAYNDVSITDLTIISKTGYTQLAGIAARDLDNSAPTGTNILVWRNRGSASPPILSVTHGAATDIKKLGGIDYADLKKVGGIAIGSIKKIGGIQ